MAGQDRVTWHDGAILIIAFASLVFFVFINIHIINVIYKSYDISNPYLVNILVMAISIGEAAGVSFLSWRFLKRHRGRSALSPS